MNKINNQFTSIEQITDRYLGTGKGNSTVNASGLSFEEILKQKQDVSESSGTEIFQTCLHETGEQKNQSDKGTERNG